MRTSKQDSVTRIGFPQPQKSGKPSLKPVRSSLIAYGDEPGLYVVTSQMALWEQVRPRPRNLPSVQPEARIRRMEINAGVVSIDRKPLVALETQDAGVTERMMGSVAAAGVVMTFGHQILSWLRLAR